MQISPEIPLYQLIFKNPPKTPIFAGAKIRDHEGSSLQILLLGPSGTPCSPPSPIKIELLPLDGDFPSRDDWTGDEFERAILKERAGKRPLLTGDVSNINMRGGVAVIGDLQFTDNSSWIRNRHFRVGVRAAPGSYNQFIIKETMTERFIVRDHRGECEFLFFTLYQYHEVLILHSLISK
jgi:Calmodulin binding protein-like